jgi:hypothetical protein
VTDITTSAQSFFPAPPILITGMHRSGTSLVARCLKDLGVFIGSDLEKNYESIFFQGLSAWVFSLAHTGWDAPLPLRFLFEDEKVFSDCIEKLHKALQHGSLFREYGVPSGFFSWGTPAIPDRWGWKDPRLFVLMPLWGKLFPQAKWVVVHRDGRDVADSLVARELSGEHRLMQSFPLSVGYEEFISLRCREPERAFNVWQEYQDVFEVHRASLSSTMYELFYEKLCEQPGEELEKLAAFVGTDPNPKIIEHLIQDIKNHGATRVRGQGAKVPAADECPHLKRLGYV